MLHALLVTTALAQPAAVAPPVPVTTDLGLHASLLGGVDRWDAGGGSSGELQLGIGARRAHGPLTLDGGYGSTLQGWAGPWAVDLHHLHGSLQHRAGAGVEAALTGSGSQGWLEGRVAPGWQLDGERGLVRFSAGAVARGFADGAVPGAAAHLWGRWLLHRRLQADGWAQARLWTDRRLPATASGGVSLTWNPWLDLSLTARGGGTVAAAGPQPARAGLVGGGDALVRTDAEVAWWAASGVAVLVSGGWEHGLGAAPYERLRGLLGVRFAFGRTHTNAQAADVVRLRVEAPTAEAVAVVGDFTDWRPLALTRAPDGWAVELSVPPGEYEYVYLVDGEPLVPPESPQRRDDGFGGENGVLLVLDPG